MSLTRKRQWVRKAHARWLAGLFAGGFALAAQAELATLTVQRVGVAARYVAEGVVEAVRESQLSAQFPGHIVALDVTAGDSVAAGQALVRVDSRMAAEQLSASRAELDAARADYERQRQLFDKQYISRAAMERAEARYKALRAQAASAATQNQLHAIAAPYAGIVAAVPVAVGDMALPGKPLLTLYDPQRLRVAVDVPDSVAQTLRADAAATLEMPAAGTTLTSTSIEILPTRDAAAHTARVRLSLPAESGARPGQFARASLPLHSGAASALLIPRSAIVRRAEFDAVYVVASDGRAQLRQLHLGRARGDDVEVLAGLDAGERIARDPLAAARQ